MAMIQILDFKKGLTLIFSFIGYMVAAQVGCVKTAPYVENIDLRSQWRYNFTIGGFNNRVDTCWQFIPARDSSEVFRWRLILDGGGDPLYGEDMDDSSGHVTQEIGKLYALWVKPPTTGRPDTVKPSFADLYLPPIVIDSLSKPELQWDYHMYGNDIGALEVRVRNYHGNHWTTVDSLVGEQQVNEIAHYKSHRVALTAVADTIVINFRAHLLGAPNCNILLDDFLVEEAAVCPPPNQLELQSIYQDTAVYIFEKTRVGSNVELRYGQVGLPPTHKQMTSVVQSGSKIKIGGLEEGQIYDVYARSICSGVPGDYTQFPITLRMPCDGFKEFPYFENFDDWMGDTLQYYRMAPEPYLGVLNSCWTNNGEIVNLKILSWISRSSIKHTVFKSPPKKDKSGSGKYVIQHRMRSSSISYLESPQVDLSHSSRPELSFWFHNGDFTTPNRLFIDISTGSIWKPLDTVTTPVQRSCTDLWAQKVIDLSAYKDTVQIRFGVEKPIDTYKNSISLDEIHFREKPGCALAGPDSTVQICDSLLSYDLSGLLDSLATGGFWRDVKGSGALNGTVLNLNQLPQDSAFHFRYVIPADSACTADSATFTLIRNQAGCSIGLEEYKLPGLDIFPNPAGQRLYLRPHNPQLKWGAVALYNLQGQRLPVELSVGAAGQRSLSLAEVPRGVYFVKLELDGKKLVRKIVVEQ